MNIYKNNTVLVAGVALHRLHDEKEEWFILKKLENEGWELPKIVVRKGESSVRAALRVMGEKGAMSTKVLEEATRFNSTINANGKNLSQRTIYYVMILKSSPSEVIGFGEFEWLEYSAAFKRLDKKEQKAIKASKEIYTEWKKAKEARRKKKKALAEQSS